MTMTYIVKATQTINKYFDITADSNVEAWKKVLDMVGNVEIIFDAKPYLVMETDVKML